MPFFISNYKSDAIFKLTNVCQREYFISKPLIILNNFMAFLMNIPIWNKMKLCSSFI